VRRDTQHLSLLTVVSATSAPPFQPLRHQRNFCHQESNFSTKLSRQTLPTVNRKHFFMNIFALSPFAHKNTHNRTLLFGSIFLMHGRCFDYRNQPLNMRIRVFYLDYYEAELCCYLVIHIENLLRPLQLFYFHL
jgi:hypothetical protein